MTSWARERAPSGGLQGRGAVPRPPVDGSAVHPTRAWTVPAGPAGIPHPPTGSPRARPTGLTRRYAACPNEIKIRESASLARESFQNRPTNLCRASVRPKTPAMRDQPGYGAVMRRQHTFGPQGRVNHLSAKPFGPVRTEHGLPRAGGPKPGQSVGLSGCGGRGRVGRPRPA